MRNATLTPSYFNQLSIGHFPAMIGIKIITIEDEKLTAEMPIKKEYFAPNGFLHAGSIVTFADTVAGYASLSHLPEKATSFTTLELKSNFVGAAKEGSLICECNAEHLGRTTHIWSVVVHIKETGKKVALFSCTQLILY